MDLILEIRIKGGAVTPDVEIYQSVSDSLRDKGLALKKRVMLVGFATFLLLLFVSCTVSMFNQE